jgi:hypothetical protein
MRTAKTIVDSLLEAKPKKPKKSGVHPSTLSSLIGVAKEQARELTTGKVKEYQFKIGNVWIDIDARSRVEAVRLLNRELYRLEEPLSIPGYDGWRGPPSGAPSGQIKRVVVDINRSATQEDIVYIYDPEGGEERPR